MSDGATDLLTFSLGRVEDTAHNLNITVKELVAGKRITAQTSLHLTFEITFMLRELSDALNAVANITAADLER